MTTYKKIQENAEDLTKQRNERCEPVAKEIYKIIAKSDIGFIPSNDQKDRDKFIKQYDPLIKEIVNILKERNIPVNEWNYIVQIAQVPFDHVKTYVAETVNFNINEALTYLWGKEEKELTFEDIEGVLKKSVK